MRWSALIRCDVKAKQLTTNNTGIDENKRNDCTGFNKLTRMVPVSGVNCVPNDKHCVLRVHCTDTTQCVTI